MIRILVMEDEPAMQMGLQDNLEFEGFEVTVVGDGEQALAQLRANIFDLALLDVMVPKISGF